MSMNLLRAAVFLINTVFTIYILAVMLRFFLQWVKADFYNPLCQFLIKITNPTLRPFRKIIPGWFGLDLAAVVLMLILMAINVLLLALITHFPIGAYLIVIVIVKLIKLTLNMYFFAIIVRAIMSWGWSAHQPHNPIFHAMIQLTEPVLRPIRKIIPVISGFDLSPVVALIVLQLISLLIGGAVGL